MRALGLLSVLAVLLAAGPASSADKLEPAQLVGTWEFVSGEKDGEAVPADRLKTQSVVLDKEKLTLKGDETFIMKYTLDASKTPCKITIEITEGPVGKGSKSEGIIELKGDELKLCYAMPDQAAPKEFAAKKGSMSHFFVLKKKK